MSSKKKKNDFIIYEIEADPTIGATEENYKEIKIDKDQACDDFWLRCIINHRKIVNQKVMLLCLYESGRTMYCPLKQCYKLANAAYDHDRSKHSPHMIDDYLIKHKLLHQDAPIKNRWRKLGYRNNPNCKPYNSVSIYDDWTTDRKLLKIIKSHVSTPIMFGYQKNY